MSETLTSTFTHLSSEVLLHNKVILDCHKQRHCCSVIILGCGQQSYQKMLSLRKICSEKHVKYSIDIY